MSTSVTIYNYTTVPYTINTTPLAISGQTTITTSADIVVSDGTTNYTISYTTLSGYYSGPISIYLSTAISSTLEVTHTVNGVSSTFSTNRVSVYGSYGADVDYPNTEVFIAFPSKAVCVGIDGTTTAVAKTYSSLVAETPTSGGSGSGFNWIILLFIILIVGAAIIGAVIYIKTPKAQ